MNVLDVCVSVCLEGGVRKQTRVLPCTSTSPLKASQLMHSRGGGGGDPYLKSQDRPPPPQTETSSKRKDGGGVGGMSSPPSPNPSPSSPLRSPPAPNSRGVQVDRQPSFTRQGSGAEGLAYSWSEVAVSSLIFPSP